METEFLAHPRQSVVHMWREIILLCLAWEFDFTLVNDQHTKLKLIITVFRAVVIIREFIYLSTYLGLMTQMTRYSLGVAYFKIQIKPCTKVVGH
jgi:hypothetical protein